MFSPLRTRVEGTVNVAANQTAPVHVAGTVQVAHSDTWTVAQEWQRLDTVAGLVLQTSIAVLIAAASFYTQTPSPVRQTVLISVGGACFVGALLAGIALSYRPAALNASIPHTPDKYGRKRWCTSIALVLLVISVEIGVPMTVFLTD